MDNRVQVSRHTQPAVRLFAALVILASLWGLVNQLTLWNRPVSFNVGVADRLDERQQDGVTTYTMGFTLVDTGEHLTFRIMNNGPVLDYFATQPTSDPIGVRYWTDDLTVTAVHPLEVNVPPIRDRIPLSGVLVGTSAVGLLIGIVLLIPGTIHRGIHRLGRPRRDTARAR